MNGILNICKPVGISSFGCLKQVKRKLGLQKVGHLGTLDPNACGVLVLLCGTATKLNQQLSGGTKVYRSVFTFGIETDTLDPLGQIVARSEILPSVEQIKIELENLTGAVEIEVPHFSAVHINIIDYHHNEGISSATTPTGFRRSERAYDLARRGIEFTAPKKVVNIKRFELLQDIKYLDLHRTEPLGEHEFFFEIECETGTYVRSLAKLLAERLGTVAIASTIIRTRVGEFKIEDAKGLEDVTSDDIRT